MNKLENSFHGTRCWTRKTDEEIERLLEDLACRPWGVSEADKAWARRVRRTLCGVEGCCCGDRIGRRG